MVYSTGGEIEADYDVPVAHTLEPELRRLNVPTRMIKGKVVLGGDEEAPMGEGYTVCKEGEVLDSRQTRLLKMFNVCMSEFKVQLLAYWTAETGSVTELTAPPPKSLSNLQPARKRGSKKSEKKEEESDDDDEDVDAMDDDE